MDIFYSVFKCEIIVINDISILKKILINELFTEMLDKFMILSTSVLGKALQKQPHVLKLFSD